MNKIEIPKEIFENIFFAEGGQKKDLHKAMTGEYQFALNMEKPVAQPNAEVEGGEYILDSKGIRKFEGKSHEKGGMPVKLEEGSRIISNHLKIGVDLAKELNKSLKLPFKATDTYAKALDRFTNASGLTKVNEELQKLIAKMDEQKSNSNDKETFALNNQFLNNAINNKSKEKEPLEKERAKFFDTLFKSQEQSKKEDSGYKMEMGGDYSALAAKHNISPERAKELLKNLPHYQDAGFANPFADLVKGLGFDKGSERPENMSDAEYYQKQAQNRVIGETKGKARTYTDKEKELIKKHYAKFVLDKKSLDNLNKAIDSNELVFNPGMLETIGTGKVLPIQLQHKDNPKGTYGSQDEARINGYLYNETFKQKTGRDFDPNNPDDTKLIYNEVIPALKEKGIVYQGAPFRGQKVDAYGNIVASEPGFVVSDEAKKSGNIDLDAFRRQSPGGKQMIADEYGIPVSKIEESTKNSTNKFLKLTGKVTPVVPGTPPTTPPSTPPSTPPGIPPVIPPVIPPGTPPEKEKRTRRGLLLLPDQTPLMPSSIQPSLKIQRRYSRIGYNDISPEQALTEMNRSEVGAQNQLKDMSPQQRAAALSAMTANANTQSNKVIADTNRANAAGRNAVDVYNAKVSDAEENASGQDALDYERRTYIAQNAYEQNLNNFYNRLQENQMNNWKTVEGLNRYNALNPDVQFTGEGYETSNTLALNPSEMKFIQELRNPGEETKKTKAKTKTATAKFGGRFKK
jgi:hypothetical protein